MKILLIEDNQGLAQAINEVLAGHEIQNCYRLEQAWNEINKRYDLYIVDLCLPDGNGLDFIQYVREFSSTPVIVISNIHDEETILKSYSYLIDDYIEKPFRIAIFKAKIESLATRTNKKQEDLAIGDIHLDALHSKVRYLKEEVDLSVSECAILEKLFLAWPNDLQAWQLKQFVFQKTGREMSDATFSARISNVKKKILPFPFTVKGKRNSGYHLKFNEEQDYE
ncbi:hypothetical protein C815_01841 [Firmicutes bacterium M10-2]|nr:hypothetical protein C815_01841 [Firmicutes bacterium M10-2]